MFKRGSIRKIEVKNFVTYSYVEWYPGPNLNMIIGPNGTGKSTIVAAIILGLGGNPKVVGRGSKVSEYVKHGADEATVNIHLQTEAENNTNFLKITRTFTKQDKSYWALNNQKVNLKDVLDCIKGYNIQVDNLCQFLPQDRVADFAKMNQQDLLKQTQVALCCDDLVERQKNLIEKRDNFKKLGAVVENYTTKLQEAQDANMRLQGKVENYNKKKKFMDQVRDIERKVAWVQYDKLHDKLTETKNDMNQARTVFEKYKNSAAPLEKEITEAKNKVTKLQKNNSEVMRSISDCENSMRNSLEKFDQYKESITHIKNEMSNKIVEIEQRNRDMEATLSKIEEMKQAHRELLNKCGNDEEVRQKVERITSEIKKFNAYKLDLQNRKEDLINSKQNDNAQLLAYQNEIQRLENVKQQRLEYLRRVDQDAYNAVLWLRNNKHLFKHEVFEPMMLEINVHNSKHSVYVENVIPVRDRLAFTCVDKDDMNQFILKMRNEQKLTVNVVHAGDSKRALSSFQPQIPIEQLKRYGLYTYLNSLFTAPEPIMKYLYENYNVHQIPVGDHSTNRFFEQIPLQIRVFFSDKQRYSVSTSRYTGEKSIRQDEINSDGGLSISVDMIRLMNLKGQINELRNNVATVDGQIQEFDAQIGKLTEKMCKLGEEMKNIHNVKQQAQTIESRIRTMQKNIQDLRNSTVTVDSVRAWGNRKIQKVVKEMRQPHEEITNTYKNLTRFFLKSKLNLQKIENARQHAAYLENKVEELRTLRLEAENTLNQIRNVYSDYKGQAKGALQTAKSLSKNFTPEDEGFREFMESHNRLSNDLSVLQEQKNQLLSHIECLNTADDDEMKNYEERLQTIEELQQKIEQSHVELSRHTSKIATLEDQWLQPLNKLIQDINLKFSEAFERMGCAGEVSLNKGQDEKEYSQYGLCIKVCYRNGEPLQELNSIVQSGGERAVATAVFMLALQELTPVPFRCVDEINQGMDANNERRIFELLVESTDQPNTAQYFLITPKLVPNLTFSRSMMVHFVHNGPFIEPDRKWSASTLCNPQRVQIH